MKLLSKYFQYHTLLCEFHNENNINIIAITRSDNSEGYILFYKETQIP